MITKKKSLLDGLTEKEKKDIAEVESWGKPQKTNLNGEPLVEVETKYVNNEPVSMKANGVALPVVTPKTEPEVEMVLVNGKHFYQVMDEACPYYVSVTTILSALAKGKGFDIWLSKNSPEEQQDILEQASLRGSKVHRAIQLLIMGQQVDPETFEYKDDNNFVHKGLNNEEKSMVYSFTKWWHEFSPKVYASEKIVYNTTYKFAGTLDFIGTIREGLLNSKSPQPEREVFVIVDFKTSSGIYPSYEMQLAAYAAAEHQMSGRKIDTGAILRLGTKHKKGYEFKIVESLAESYRAFLGVLAAWKYQNPDFAPKFIELPKLFSLPVIQQVEVKPKETSATNDVSLPLPSPNEKI